MKKIIALLLATTLTPLLLIACSPAAKESSGKENATAEKTTSKEKPDTAKEAKKADKGASVPVKAEYKVISGAKEGNYYKAATELSELLADKGLKLDVQESPGSMDNINAVADGKVDLAFVQNDATALQKNLDKQKNTKLFSKLMIFAPISDEVVHIVVNKSAGIKKLTDLKGKKVAVGPKGSGTYVSSALLYYANKMDDKDTIFMDVAESIEKVKKGELDAAFFTSAIGVPLLKNISAEDGKNLELLSIDDFSFIKKQGLERIYFSENIPANSYPWQSKPAKALTTFSYILVKKDLDTEKVYEMAKAVYSQAKELKSKNPFWTKLGTKEAKEDIEIGSPYHPGVAKFLKEK